VEYEGLIQQEKKARVDTAERKAMLEELAAAEKVANETNQELDQYKEKDPEIINNRKKKGEEALKHANRWTGERLFFLLLLHLVGPNLFIPLFSLSLSLSLS